MPPSFFNYREIKMNGFFSNPQFIYIYENMIFALILFNCLPMHMFFDYHFINELLVTRNNVIQYN